MAKSRMSMGFVAVGRVSDGESIQTVEKGKAKFNFALFVKNFTSWLLSFMILSGMFIVLETVGSGEVYSFFTIFGSDLNVLNMMVSFILTVLLEQIWNFESTESNAARMATMGIDLFLLVVGIMLYVIFTILEGFKIENFLVAHKIAINWIFLIFSLFTIIFNILVRSFILE